MREERGRAPNLGAVRRLGLPIIVLAALAVRCKESNDITGLLRATAPTPAPTAAPSADLTGTWSGTISAHGATDDDFCPSSPTAVSVQIGQVGGKVTFRVPSGTQCLGSGPVDFAGSLAGNRLSGDLQRQGGECTLKGAAGGTGERSRIVLDGHLSGTCNRLGVHIELSR